MATMQVRSMDNKLYEALKARAKADNRSISQEVITILQKYLSKPEKQSKNATEAFLELAGSFEDSRSADKIINDIKKSRSTRRFREGNFNVFD